MKKEFIIAIDLGTTGNRVFCFDPAFQLLSSAYRELKQIFPQPGWVEHDPDEILASIYALLSEAISKGNLDPANIISIGITNQRETTVMWNKHGGKPVCNAIVWQCRRTSGICGKLKEEGLSGLIKEKTGLVLDPYFSASKIQWIIENTPGLMNKCRQGDILFGTIDTWILWNLTGGKTHATDFTNASRTMLLNISSMKWDDSLLSIFNIPSRILPEVYNSSHPFGKTLNVPGIPDGTLIGGIAGDQQAAMAGQYCVEPGMSKNTYGTGCFLLQNTGSERKVSSHGLITTIACDDTGKPCYALEGSVFAGGAVIQWLRDKMHFLNDSSEAGSISSGISVNDDIVCVPAFTGLGAPYWDMDVRGAIFGLTRDTTPQQIVRAANKSIALQSFDLMKAMSGDSGYKISKLKADGKAAGDTFLMQYQADILGIPIVVPAMIETTALGAAFLAALTAGLYAKISDISADTVSSDTTYAPDMQDEQILHEINIWKIAIQRLTSKL